MPQPQMAAECGGGQDSDEVQKLRLIEIFRQHAQAYRAQFRLTPEQERLLAGMERCRTAALGGHLYRCDHCGFELPIYNSCGNRGCPNCQALEQTRWIEAREQRILPVGHHHVVFTLPSQLRPLAKLYPRAIYALVLQSAGKVLTMLGHDELKARLGATLILHTWTRELNFHPHVHCIVTSGGLVQDGQIWRHRKGFLFSIRQLKARFRALLIAGLDQLRRNGLKYDEDPEAWSRLFATLPKAAQWVVWIEKPFGRSTHVLQYLGRYTHRVGLSDSRLLAVSDTAVTFATRDGKTLTLPPLELMRRYFQHVLPHGLNKIRHVGLYAATHVRGELAVARQLLGDGDKAPVVPTQPTPTEPEPYETWTEFMTRVLGVDPRQCPTCRQGRLLLEATIDRSRAPPEPKL